MAGHSKWANIKHRKGAQDAKRSKIFTRIIKELTIAAREGGDDPDANPRLRLAIQNAKGANMPKDNMERAIKKGAGGEGADLLELTFEGYAPHGIAVYVETSTDNQNRTVAAVRSIFSKYGGSLGTNGSLSFLFDRKGVFQIKRSELADKDLEMFQLEMIDAGLQEMDQGEEFITIYTAFEDYGNMQSALEEKEIEVQNTELQRIPNTTTALGVEEAKQVLKLIDKMEEEDDVNDVFHNLEMTDELEKSLMEE